MNEELLGLLGATPEQIAQARRQSGFEELGLLGQALMQAGAPAPRGTSTLSRLGQAAGMYTQAPRQTMDTLLQDLLRRQQVQDLQTRRQQEQAAQQRQASIQSAMALPDMKQRIEALRGLGAYEELSQMGAAEKAIRPLTRTAGEVSIENPFMLYEQAQSPQVRKLASQLSKGYESGAIDEEKAYTRIGELAKMEDRYLSTQESRRTAAAIREEAKAKEAKPTGEQMKAATLAGRLERAMEDLQAIEGKNPDALTPEIFPSLLQSGVISWIPGSDMIAGKISSEDRLRAEAAQLDALDAALTLGTGAAYTREQLRGYAKSYFPQVGDGPDVIADKVLRFNNLVKLAKKQAGPAYFKPDTPGISVDSLAEQYGLEPKPK